jgi:hypothetical protein
MRGAMRFRSRLLILIAALAPLWASAAELNSGTPVAESETTASVALFLHPAGDAIAGLQFDVEYDGSAVEVSATTGDAAEQAGKTVQSAVVHPGLLRVLIVGLNRNEIAEGIVATVRVKLLNGNAGASTLRLTSSAATNGRAEKVALALRGSGIPLVFGRKP